MAIKGYNSKVCGVCGITESDFKAISSASILNNMRPKAKTTQVASIISFRKNTNSSRVVSLF